MFGFLKDKLKQVVKKLTKDVDEQAEESAAPEEPEVVEEPKPEEKEEPKKEPEPKEKEEPEKHPVDELLEEEKEEEKEEAPAKEEPTPEEVKKEEPILEELEKEEPEVVKEEPSPEVVEEKPEPEVVEEKPEPEVVGEKEEPTPAEPISEEKEDESLPEQEKPAEQVAKEAKELVEEAQQVQAEETTDVLFEEEKKAPTATEEDQTETVLKKVGEAEKKEEHKKVEEVIGKLEEKEKKGFFDRIKDVFSKEEEPKAEEEKDVERELLGEGLSEEEKKFVAKVKVKETGIDPVEEKIGKELAKEESEPAPEPEPATKEPEKPEEPKAETAELVKEESKEKKGFFEKLTQAVTTKTLTEKQFDEIFWELEVGLMEANVAIEVIEKIKNDLKASLVDQKLPRSKIGETISTTLSKSIDSLFDVPTIDILAMTKEKKPLTIAFFGVNGAGKTTTIAKFAHWLKKNKKTCVLAAGDTFRAAAIQQLEEHANKLGVKMIKHDYGSDSAAVGFDAIKYAEQKGLDVVLIDTAGRLHSNVNLMDELKKIIRVCKPDVSLFVGESITGNDCIEQAKKFDEAVGVDGIILTKADVDDKGGTAVSVSFVTKKPILFLGMGQEYDDLKEFDKSIVLGSLELS